jgi:hypothetical protein
MLLAMTVRLAMIIGGLVNIPVKRIAHEWVVPVHPLAIFGLGGLWPEMRRERRETSSIERRRRRDGLRR